MVRSSSRPTTRRCAEVWSERSGGLPWSPTTRPIAGWEPTARSRCSREISSGSGPWRYVRVPAELGLVARLVPGVTEGGFDPAAGYRRFDESIERLESGT